MLAQWSMGAVGMFAASLLIGCSATGNGNEGALTFTARSVPTYDARTFYETVSVFGASFTHDGGSLLISSDETGVFNVYAIDLETGEKSTLTRSTTDARFAVSAFPDDGRLLYSADEGGNEITQLFVRDTDGTSRNLTPGEGVRASFAGWHEDDKHFFVMTNERDPQAMDLYRYSVDRYEREMVYQNTQNLTVEAVSRDGRYIALGKTRNNADSDLYLFDTRFPDQALRHITPHEGDAVYSAQTFTPDSKDLVYTTNDGTEFAAAYRYTIADGSKQILRAGDWDVTNVAFSESGRYMVDAMNAEARTVVSVTDQRTGKPVVLPDLPAGDITGVRFNDREDTMAFYVNGDTSPSNLYVMSIRDGRAGAYRRLTDTLNPSVDPDALVEGEVVYYPSFDGLKIPAILYRPKNATAANPAPAVLFAHGGPGGQSRKGYRADFQFLVNHGYAIFAVNNRGSSGYGKTFFHLDDRDHGGGDLQDYVYARKYLEGLDWIDGDRVAIMGGSYGGYLVAAALAFEPEAFDAGINIFGVTNWVRTLQSIPPWWADFREALYAELGDPNDPEQLERLKAISPLFHAENIVRPMLVVQGANDPRVLQVESDELVEAARANGATVEYVIFEDEGHGFRNRENRITAAEAYLNFLNEHLADTP